MTHIKAGASGQPSLFRRPDEVMLDLHITFMPSEGMTSDQIGARLMNHLLSVTREIEPLSFFSTVAHQAKHPAVQTQGLQGLGYLLLGGEPRRFHFPTFPKHSHSPQEAGAEIARTASEVTAVEFREASIRLMDHAGTLPVLDNQRLTLLLNALRWPQQTLTHDAFGAFQVRDRYHPMVTLWMLDNPPHITEPLRKHLDWLRLTCPSKDHGEFEPPPKSHR